MDNQLQEIDHEYLKELGDELYEAEDFFGAIKVFLLITEYFPEDLDSKARLVTCYFWSGLPTLARKQLKELDEETGGDSQDWLSSMLPAHLVFESMVLSDAGCADAVIARLEQYFALGVDEEDFDTKLLLAVAYQHARRYQEAVDLYEEMLLLIDEPDAKVSILIKMIDCYKPLENFNMVKETIGKAAEFQDQDNPFPEIAVERSALAYMEQNYQEALKQINLFEESIANTEFDNDEKKNELICIHEIARLTIKLALNDKKWVRETCYDWIESKIPTFDDPPTQLNGYIYEQLYNCIRYTQESDLLLRLADSDFVKKYAPQLEFAYKALAARMLGDDKQAYQQFDKYKQVFKERIEEHGDNFEEEWEEMKSDEKDIGKDFVIPDNDPPIPVIADEYIERYGK